MAIKKLFLLTIILILCLSRVFAQTETPLDIPYDDADEEVPEQSNFFIDRSGDEPRFIQRLIWEESIYVFRYEVIVEQLEDGEYHEVERLSVEENFAEVSLIAGQYRYRLDIYDLVDEFSFATEWREFEVVRALRPELTGFSPQAFWLDEDDNWVINLYGQNLLPQSVFYLVQDNIRITPHSHTGEGTSARLEFSGVSLVLGEYSIHVVNPGGLDDSLGRFTIGNRKPFELNFSLGYAPIIPMYGYLFNDTALDAPFPGSFYPLGAVVKISFVPYKRLWGNLGAEFSGSFAYLEHEREDYTTNAYLMNVHLGFLYQKYFLRRIFSFSASVGIGITSLMDFHYQYPVGPPSENITGHYPSASAELSLTMFFSRPFFVNAGANFIHVLTPEEDRPMPGFVRPFITVGIQL